MTATLSLEPVFVRKYWPVRPVAMCWTTYVNGLYGPLIRRQDGSFRPILIHSESGQETGQPYSLVPSCYHRTDTSGKGSTAEFFVLFQSEFHRVHQSAAPGWSPHKKDGDKANGQRFQQLIRKPRQPK